MRELIAIGIVVGPVALAILIVWADRVGEALIGIFGSLVLLSAIVAADVAGAGYGWTLRSVLWQAIAALCFGLFVCPCMGGDDKKSTSTY